MFLFLFLEELIKHPTPPCYIISVNKIFDIKQHRENILLENQIVKLQHIFLYNIYIYLGLHFVKNFIFKIIVSRFQSFLYGLVKLKHDEMW